MRLLGKTRIGLTIASVAIILGGCATRGDKIADTNRSLQDQNQRLQGELREARAMLGERGNANQDARDLIGEYQTEIASLESQLNERDRTIREFGDQIDNFDIRLDPSTNRALANLARQYSALMSYDPERQMLRFNSDLTFDSGSAVVKDNARTTLGKLAGILNNQAAISTAIEIVGHTDSEPMSSATRQRHFSNLHLSTHRAVSVHKVLQEMGVAPERLIAAGRGPFDPLVANSAKGGTPQNRRVEIFIRQGGYTPAQIHAGVSEGSIDIDRATPPARTHDVTK